MSPDLYVQIVLSRYDVSRRRTFEPHRMVVAPLGFELVNAFPGMLNFVKLSGSNAKGTAIAGATDVDLFLSFSPFADSLHDIYEAVFAFALSRGYQPRRQNVSIGINYYGYSVDLVPGRQQPTPGYHSIYRRRVGSWQQTNIDIHIQQVRESGRTEVIRAVKIWRQLHGIDFPSFFLELLVLQALTETPDWTMSGSLLTALHYIGTNLEKVRLIDPANSNNVVSDDLTAKEKAAIAAYTSRMLSTASWSEIIR